MSSGRTACSPPQWSRWIVTRPALLRLAVLAGLIILVGIVSYILMIKMPGQSFRGPLPVWTQEEQDLAVRLQRDVEHLATGIGRRNWEHPSSMKEAARYIEERLAQTGHPVEAYSYNTMGQSFTNLQVEWTGRNQPEEIVVVGAHYDTVGDSPGANDNGSGIAALLALAESFADQTPRRTLRFVAFANEEPPFFQTDQMGSRVYARRCRQRGENIVAMLSLETIGYYSEEADSQSYPFPLSLAYPDTANFIGIVGDTGSKELVRRAVKVFRDHTAFPSEGAALPGWLTGVAWSDHWSFRQEGYPAVMITDTALFRYPHYHDRDDTPEKLDYRRMARVVKGIESIVRDLSGLPNG